MSVLEELNAVMVDVWINNPPTDASLNNTSFLKRLLENNRIRKEDLATGIRKTVVFAGGEVVATDGSGSGMTVYNEQATLSPKVEFKTIPIEVVTPAEIVEGNKSVHAKVKNIFENHVLKGQNGILNAITLQAWLDGTGNSGRDLDGMAVAISKSPETTVYADIDPQVVKQWRNFSANASDPNTILPSAGKPIDKSNILEVMDFVVNQLSLDSGRGVDLVVVGDRYFNMISTAMNEKQIIVNNSDKASLGFRELEYKGCLVINVGGLQATGSSPISDNEMYFIATSDLDLVYCNNGENSLAKSYGVESEGLKMMVYPVCSDGLVLRKQVGLLDYSMNLVFKGNFILGDRRRHGVVFEDPSAVPNPDFSLDATTGTVKVGATKDFTVTVVDGLDVSSIAVASNDTGKATVVIAGNKITVTGVAVGNSTVTVSSSAIEKTIPITITVEAA